MQKYKSNITTTSGAAVRGVPVLVIDEDGNNAALFLDRAGTVPAPNPLTTGPDGVFYFYAVNGRYSLRTTVDGVTITDDDVVLMMDPEEITVAGPIAEAVAAAQAAATAAELVVANSGIPVLVATAQNAVVDANNAVSLSTTAANNAAISKAGADSARDASVAAKNAAEAALDSFDDRYLGAKASAPATDNDGGALLTGALYWDTSLPGMRSWNGSVWVTLPAATKASVGLANVDNTSDANKPVSTAQSAAIAASTANNIHGAAAKITPADADELGLSDSAASWGLKKLTFANLKAWLAGLFVSKSGDTMTGPLTVEGENYADIMIRAYGNSGDGAVFHGNQALGTKAAPLPPSAGTPIFGIGARPWTGTQWTAHSTAAIHMFARENVSNTAQGTSFRIAVTPLGSTWEQRIHAITFECDGAGQGARWRAKMSGPLNSRAYFQDANGGQTVIGALSGVDGENGGSSLNLFAGTDPNNGAYLQTAINKTIGLTRIISAHTGGGGAAGEVLPLLIAVENGAQLLLTRTGEVLSFTGPLGYGAGARGTVEQATSKSTAVTLNKPSGQINMHNASLGAGASVVFTLVNDKINFGSTLGITLYEGGAASNYRIECVGVNAGNATIRLTNVSGASRAEVVYVYFNVIVGIA